MHNLKLLHSATSDCSDGLSNCKCFSVNNETDVIYAATDTGVSTFNITTLKVEDTIDLVSEGYLSDAHIIGVQHLPDLESLCVATSSGDVLLINCFSSELECVGSVDSGLTAMAWSPDQELVTLTTGNETVIIMSKDFDPVTERSLHPDDFGSEKPINVGWGKAETQFQGSAGKKKQTETLIASAQTFDDGVPRLSWRGDGQYFIISSVDPVTQVRMIRVWNRECEHQSTAEITDGLEQPLSWRPSGSVFASSRRKPDQVDVVLFEKNGLQHGEFRVPLDASRTKVRELLWNCDSTLLAVWTDDLFTDDESLLTSSSQLEIFTMNNYHWYMKQCVQFTQRCSRPVCIQWDSESAGSLHMVNTSGQYVNYTWITVTDRSAGAGSSDNAGVAVIDGVDVLVTPFRYVTVPPPASAFRLVCPAPVNEVVFHPPPCSNDMALLLSDGLIMFFKYSDITNGGGDSSVVKLGAIGGNGFNNSLSLPQLSDTARLSDGGVVDGSGLSHMTWLSDDSLVFVLNSAGRLYSTLCHYYKQSHDHSSTTNTFLLRDKIDLEGRLETLTPTNNSTNDVLIQLTSGSVLRYTPGGAVSPWFKTDGTQLKFPHSCVQTSLCSFNKEVSVLGLTSHHHFYVDDMRLATNCTSFVLHSEFLILTTHTHTCRCISFTNTKQELAVLGESQDLVGDETIRRVERGSKVITVTPDDTKLILQMPRGNLETIHPRALVLSSVRHWLDNQKYLKAFEKVRKHRLNMNLIYDHNPQMFLANLEAFVEQVDSVQYINLFLSELRNEDVTETMYSGVYGKLSRAVNNTQTQCSTVNNTQTQCSTESKVDHVCHQLRHILTKMDSAKYFLSIITTYIRKTIPELDTALMEINKLRSNPDYAQSSTDEALKYILYLVDVNDLYNVALGTYDFNLVILVAEKSQKDPKEYLPFLNKLRKLETNYQKFHIDKQLKRFRKALTHMNHCNEGHHDEFIDFIKQNKLFRDASQLLEGELRKEAASLYGSSLLADHHYEEAGIVFSSIGMYTEALDCHQQAGDWTQVMTMAHQLSYDTRTLLQLTHRAAVYLKQQSMFLEAGRFLYEYGTDPEDAVEMFVDGHLWNEALRLIYKHGRIDMIETHVRPAVKDAYSAMMSNLECIREKFIRQRDRLTVVREIKEREKMELMEMEQDGVGMNCDVFSDTSSLQGDSVCSQSSSQFSKTSGKSSKNRRKAQRKKYSLKEGSRFEDIGLLDSLKGLVDNVDKLRDEIGLLLRALVVSAMTPEGRTLQETYTTLLSTVILSISNIWLPGSVVVAMKDDDKEQIFGPDATVNSIVSSMQSSTIPNMSILNQIDDVDPALFIPPRLSKSNRWKMDVLST